MKRKITMLWLFLLICTPADAIKGFGPNYDCGEWFKPEFRTSARTWLMGYLSGINYATATSSQDPLSKLNSADQAYLWMDNFCKANPLKTVTQGANKLYEELEQTK